MYVGSCSFAESAQGRVNLALPERSLIVVTRSLKFLGTLTDGDVRRNIIKCVNLKNKIHNYLIFYQKHLALDFLIHNLLLIYNLN